MSENTNDTSPNPSSASREEQDNTNKRNDTEEDDAISVTSPPALLWIDSGASTTSTPTLSSPRPRISVLSLDRHNNHEAPTPQTSHKTVKAYDDDPLREPLLLPSEHLAPRRQQQQQQQPQSGKNNKNCILPWRMVDLTQPQQQPGELISAQQTTTENEERFQDEPTQPPDVSLAHPTHPHVPWYKNPYQRMAMMSNFGTSYNVVNISLVLPILDHLQEQQQQQQQLPEGTNGGANAEDTSAVASSLLAGMILGQLLGGALGDSFLGLAGALRVVMVLQIAASLGSASVHTDAWGLWQHTDMDEPHTHSLYWQLAAWRFVLGIGAGAVYPLAACLSVEQAGRASETHTKHAMRRVVRTFAVQGLGFWAVPALTLPLLHTPSVSLEATWRIVLAVGCVPGFLLLYLQWRLGRSDPQPHSHHHHHHARHERVSASDDNDAVVSERASVSVSAEEDDTVGDRELMCEDSDGEVGTFLDSSPDLDSSGNEGCYGESEPPVIRHGWWSSLKNEPNLLRKLLGTAVTWFLFDVLFYGNTLFQPIVVETAFGPKDDGNGSNGQERHVLQRTALDSFLLASIALPGYVVAGLLMGRKTCGVTQSARYVMMQGFFFMSVLYIAIGTFWHELRHYPILLVLLYGLTFFFANYGPNTTTFILPSLVYSAECRSTFNGLSAAAGKVGALCGATLFAPTTGAWGDAAVMLVCGGIGAVALGMTALFVRIPKPGEPTAEQPVTHLCFHPTAENPDSEEDDDEGGGLPSSSGEESPVTSAELARERGSLRHRGAEMT